MERADSTNLVMSEPVLQIFNDFLTAGRREVGVDVRIVSPIHIEEPLKLQIVGYRVNFRDAHEIADQRPGRRTASGSDEHASALEFVDDVCHDYEVCVQPQLVDDAHLIQVTLAIYRRLDSGAKPLGLSPHDLHHRFPSAFDSDWLEDRQFHVTAVCYGMGHLDLFHGKARVQCLFRAHQPQVAGQAHPALVIDHAIGAYAEHGIFSLVLCPARVVGI